MMGDLPLKILQPFFATTQERSVLCPMEITLSRIGREYTRFT